MAGCAEACVLTSEEMGANSAFVSIVANVTSNVRVVPIRIHHLLIRQKDHVYPGVLELFDVLGLLSRVRCEVLMWCELF